MHDDLKLVIRGKNRVANEILKHKRNLNAALKDNAPIWMQDDLGKKIAEKEALCRYAAEKLAEDKTPKEKSPAG